MSCVDKCKYEYPIGTVIIIFLCLFSVCEKADYNKKLLGTVIENQAVIKSNQLIIREQQYEALRNQETIMYFDTTTDIKR